MTSGYIQYFCLYLNQQTAASNAWTLCVCTCGAHTNTTSILSYSFSHSVELPLGFTGVVFIFTSPMWNFYSEQFRYSTHYISVYRCKRSACTLLWIFWWFSEIMYFYVFVCFGVFCFLICFSPRQHMYMTLCTNQTHAFHLSPKVWSTTFSKSFQYLKITLLLLGSLHSCSRSASCLTSLTAYEGKCYIIIGLYSRVQSLDCNLVRFW